MAYVTTNPPKLIQTGIAGVGNVWEYRSTDASAVVDGDGYITDAQSLGIKVGDTVWVHDTDAVPYAVTRHTAVTINADGSADLSDQHVAPAANTD